ncbi:MAG TPA: ABC transporter substrate-binding protein, partial [Alphaproteobacteria bacterium]|nr:ABC transporter substrate-binding protein [Alphaproteobacteria bacterium]
MKFLLAAALLFTFSAAPLHSASADYALSLYGDIKYPADFTHFDYTNPGAPKGGTLKLSSIGTFDNVNPYIIKGASADGIDALTNPTLMVQSYDEPFTMYGYVASDVALAADKSSVTFTLNPKAVWDDSKPLTADDIVWTFNTLVKDGAPFYRAYYTDVKNVTADASDKVTFHLASKNNRELPLIIAQMPILPKHYWTGKNFAETTLTPPVAAGPYKISNVTAGRSIEFTRNPDWWGKDLPVNKGRYNFD